MAQPVASYSVQVAWSTALQGVFRIGTSTIGGTDVLGGTFGGTVFDDITSAVQSIQCTRGRSQDRSAIQQGTATIKLADPTGTYNPMALTYDAAVLADSPAGYWRLGESSGTAASDSSGNGLSGTYHGGVSLAQQGGLSGDNDYAAQFNGSSGYVSLGTPSGLSFGGLSAVSLEGWFQTSDSADYGALVSRTKGGADGWALFLQPGGQLRCALGGTSLDVHATANLADGNWHHAVATYDGITARLYVDGVQVATQTVSTAVVGATVEARIGARVANDGTSIDLPFKGSLDEVAVYASTLSAARVAVHYSAGTAYLSRKLIPMRPVRARATYNGTTYGLFSGFIQSIQHNPVATVKETTLTCVDFFEWLNTEKPVIASTGATTTGAAIGKVLDAVQWTDPSLRLLDTGDSISNFSADGTKTALSLIADLLATELGQVFVNGGGQLVYQSRQTRFGQKAVAGSITGTTATAAQPSTDVRRVVNKQAVTRTGGTAQTASDTTSITKYATRQGSDISSSYLNSDTQANALAGFIVLASKDPTPPAYQTTLLNKDDASFTQMLGRELGDLVTFTESGGNSSGTCVVDGIQHGVSEGGLLHQTQFLLSQRTLSLFSIGVSRIGGADVIGY